MARKYKNTYLIPVRATWEGTVEVEADNLEDAIESAEHWDFYDKDISIDDFEDLKVDQQKALDAYPPRKLT